MRLLLTLILFFGCVPVSHVIIGDARESIQPSDVKIYIDYPEKYEKIAVAEGEAKAIEKVFSAIHKGDPTNDLIAIKYLESLEKIADGKSSKVFLPADMSAVLGSIAAVSELFKDEEE